MLPIKEISQLGATAVVSVVAIWALVQVMRNKGNNRVFIKELRENHLKGIEVELDNLKSMIQENDRKLEKIINLLIEIKGKIT